MTATQKAGKLKQKYMRNYKKLIKETWVRSQCIKKFLDSEYIDVEQ